MPQPDRPHDAEEAPWLTEAVLDVVFRYSQPCERVLVLISRTDECHPACLTALKRAAESASRLGRTVETRTVDPACPGPLSRSAEPTEPESVPGPMRPPSNSEPPGAVVHQTLKSGTGCRRTGPTPFGTVVAIVDSRSVHWVDGIQRHELFGPAGFVAFVTYSHLGCDPPDHARLDLLLFIQPLSVPARCLQ